jgi:hypothetical protein
MVKSEGSQEIKTPKEFKDRVALGLLEGSKNTN